MLVVQTLQNRLRTNVASCREGLRIRLMDRSQHVRKDVINNLSLMRHSTFGTCAWPSYLAGWCWLKLRVVACDGSFCFVNNSQAGAKPAMLHMGSLQLLCQMPNLLCCTWGVCSCCAKLEASSFSVDSRVWTGSEDVNTKENNVTLRLHSGR